MMSLAGNYAGTTFSGVRGAGERFAAEHRGLAGGGINDRFQT